MRDLHIFDVSSIVHTGMHVSSFQERSYYNYPVGGLHFLMRYVGIAISKGDDVVLCFDSPTFRFNLMPNYKSGRMKDQSVISQIESIYEGLSACGIRCMKLDGFEADDIVDWAVQQNLEDYMELIIYGNDYDLCHSVQSKVRFRTVKVGMNNIYTGNFETSIKQGEHIVFNTISAYKVFCGCSSDSIPILKLDSGVSGKELYQSFIKYLREQNVNFYYKTLTNWKLPMIFATNSGLFRTKECEEVLKRVKLVYPAACPKGVLVVPTQVKMMDKAKLCKFLTLYNDYETIRCIEGRKESINEEDRQRLRNKAKHLSSGEFAADHNLEITARLKSKILKIDSFAKEF